MCLSRSRFTKESSCDREDAEATVFVFGRELAPPRGVIGRALDERARVGGGDGDGMPPPVVRGDDGLALDICDNDEEEGCREAWRGECGFRARVDAEDGERVKENRYFTDGERTARAGGGPELGPGTARDGFAGCGVARDTGASTRGDRLANTGIFDFPTTGFGDSGRGT
jgi:hypothetical protein